MFGLSPIHLVALVAVVLLVFGRKGKVSDIMGDIGGGFKAFHHGLSDAEEVKKELVKLPLSEKTK